MSIQLMLAREDGSPYLSDEGCDPDTAAGSATAIDEFQLLHAREDFSDPNDLAKQHWGLIVPEGTEGQRLAQLMAPLIAARREQQGGDKPFVFTVPPNMTAEAARKWWGSVYNNSSYNGVKLTELNRPRYLLILGDPTEVSWEAQQCFSADAFVGRLSFLNDAGYEAYIHKILAYERAAKAAERKVRAAFYTVLDGTAATSTGDRGLMKPTIAALQENYASNQFPASEILPLGANSPLTPEDFIRALESRYPTMLFTISHGVGAAANVDEMERRRIQGAMSFGQGKRITGEDVANRPFLPGGAWFFFACFSAGTPTKTAYQHWLASLKQAGLNVRQSDIDGVLTSLAKERSFVAALPQAALANPDGPLAVMGHVDLAWTFSFQDGLSRAFRPSRYHNIFRGIVDHARIGPAYFDLQRVFNFANSELTDMIDSEERARAINEPLPEDKERSLRKAGLWMLRQDLTAYVLLGDPAASVAASASEEEVRNAIPNIVTEKPADVSTTNPSTTSSPNAFAGDMPDNAPAEPNSLAKVDPAKVEAAVFPKLGDEALEAIAKHFGVPRAELDGWMNTYAEGGRAAVRAKNSA